MSKHNGAAATQQETVKDILLRAVEAFQDQRPEEAEQLTNELLTQLPDLGPALNISATVLLWQNKNLDEAKTRIQHAISVEPNNAFYYDTLANILREQGNAEQALPAHKQAINLAPQPNAEFFKNAGKSLIAQEHYAEAIQYFEHAAQLAPQDAQHLHLAATASFLAFDFPRTIELETRALAIKPDYSEARKTLADVHFKIGDYEAAKQDLEQLLVHNPNHNAAKVDLACLLPHVLMSNEEIDQVREAFDTNLTKLINEGITLEHPEREIISLPFHHAYHGCDNKRFMEKLGEFYKQLCPQLNYTASHCNKPHRKKEKIRIGFASAHFYTHVVSICFTPLIEQLAKDENFEIFALSFSTKEDEWTDRLVKCCKDVIVAPGKLSDAQKAIAELELDILFHLDIGMDAFAYFLAHARLAPIQCSSGGHPMTSGLKTIDYYLASHLLEPGNGQNHYTEKLALFDHVCARYPRPEVPALSDKTRKDFNLPGEDVHLYTCPVALFRIHPDLDSIFKQLLDQDDKAHIILFNSDFPTKRQALIEHRFAQTIGPEYKHRIHFQPFAPGDEFIHIMRLMDAIIDPLHFSMGTTAYKLFAVGLPIITLPGEFMRGRVAYGLYQKMGITDTIAQNASEYVALAKKVAQDPEFRQNVSSKIQQQNHLLYDDFGIVDEWSAFFKQAYEQL